MHRNCFTDTMIELRETWNALWLLMLAYLQWRLSGDGYLVYLSC